MKADPISHMSKEGEGLLYSNLSVKLPALTSLASQRAVKGVLSVTIAATLAALVGCAASAPSVPVRRPIGPVPTFYTVQQGDSLSKIAMRYGLDYQDLARINQIGPDYIIHVNQRLRLVDNGNRVQTSGLGNSAAIASQPLNNSAQSVSGTTPPSSNTQTLSGGVTTYVASPNSGTTSTYAGVVWRWPVDMAVTQGFDPAHQIKGLRFTGNAGDPVRAAADGTVIYAGNGLPEYGNLILVQHNNGYISAYAHNQRMLVVEKARVTAGQQIAEMGSSGSNYGVMLEFQVRLNGKPMDPTLVLPKR